MDEPEKKFDTIFEALDEKSPEIAVLQKMSSFLTELQEKFGLNDEELQVVDGELTLYIVKKNTEQVLIEDLWNQLLIAKNKDVVNGIIGSVRTFIDLNKKQSDIIKTETDVGNTPTTTAPSPANVLASLKARLTTPTAIAPANRELPPGPMKSPMKPAETPSPAATMPANAAPTVPASAPKKNKFDIYREQV